MVEYENVWKRTLAGPLYNIACTLASVGNEPWMHEYSEYSLETKGQIDNGLGISSNVLGLEWYMWITSGW